MDGLETGDEKIYVSGLGHVGDGKGIPNDRPSSRQMTEGRRQMRARFSAICLLPFVVSDPCRPNAGSAYG
jgi:hypothetical protein